jgi:hypothetical protein
MTRSGQAAQRRGVFLALLALGSAPAAAIELEDGKLSLNGFGSWAYGASDRNDFLVARHTGHFDSGDFALALTSRLSDRAVAGAQLRYAPDHGGLFLDWAFGEWRFSDLVRVRAGVVKHPLGIFGEVPNVGTLRPFFLLPQGIYGQAEITGSGVGGVSVSGIAPSRGGWGFSYDLYGGELRLRVDEVIPKILEPSNLVSGGTLAVHAEETKYVVGGRLIVTTPFEGLEVRLSAYGTPIREENGPRIVAGPSLQYLGDTYSVRAEYFYFYEEASQRSHAAYVEAARFLTDRFQIGARAEIYQTTSLQTSVSSSLFKHREIAATFNYWFDPGLVAKLSIHAVDGNRFAFPTALDDALLGGGLNRHTIATILGVQFSF